LDWYVEVTNCQPFTKECCPHVQYTDAGLYTCSQGGRSHKIPGSYGHYSQDAETYASWGVECKPVVLLRLH